MEYNSPFLPLHHNVHHDHCLCPLDDEKDADLQCDIYAMDLYAPYEDEKLPFSHLIFSFSFSFATFFAFCPTSFHLLRRSPRINLSVTQYLQHVKRCLTEFFKFYSFSFIHLPPRKIICPNTGTCE